MPRKSTCETSSSALSTENMERQRREKRIATNQGQSDQSQKLTWNVGIVEIKDK